MLASTNMLDFKSIIKAISDQYEILANEQTRLKDECCRYRDSIEFQVKLIHNVTNDIEKLRGEIKDQLHLFTPDVEQTAQNNQTEGGGEPEGEISLSVLVPAEEITMPLNFVSLAEIVDVSVICRVVFSPNGKLLAIGSNNAIRVYNIETGEFDCEFSIPSGEFESKYVRSLAWDPNGTILFTGCEDHNIRIYNIEEKKLITEIPTSGEVYDIKVAHNGTFFVAAIADSSALIFNYPDPEIKYKINREPNAYSTCISISPDDVYVALGGNDKKVIVWSTVTNNIINEIIVHQSDVYSIIFFENGKRMATGSLDCKIKIWAFTDGRLDPIATVDGHSEYVLTLAVDHTGRWLISGSKDQTVGFTDLTTQHMVYKLASHSNSVITVDFSPTDSTFATGSGDMAVHISSYVTEEHT